jgi:hypothetical protein
MRPPEDSWEEWLEEATAGIASNSLARSVRRELRAHLIETVAAVRDENLDGDDAAREALRRMGNPHTVCREWQARVAGGGALLPAALALAALLQLFSWDGRQYLLMSWLLVGLAVLASRRFQAWLHDAAVLLAGIWRGTVSGINTGVAWSGPLLQVGPVGLVTGLAASLEPVWKGLPILGLSGPLTALTLLLIVLGTPISVFMAMAFARRSDVGVAPDAATMRGGLALILGFAAGAVGGWIVEALVLSAIGFRPYSPYPPHPALLAYLASFAQTRLSPVTLLYAILVLGSAWLTMGIAAFRRAWAEHQDAARD